MNQPKLCLENYIALLIQYLIIYRVLIEYVLFYLKLKLEKALWITQTKFWNAVTILWLLNSWNYSLNVFFFLKSSNESTQSNKFLKSSNSWNYYYNKVWCKSFFFAVYNIQKCITKPKWKMCGYDVRYLYVNAWGHIFYYHKTIPSPNQVI